MLENMMLVKHLLQTPLTEACKNRALGDLNCLGSIREMIEIKTNNPIGNCFYLER